MSLPKTVAYLNAGVCIGYWEADYLPTRNLGVLIIPRDLVQVALNSFSPHNFLEIFWRAWVCAPGIGFIYWGKYLEGKNNYEL